MEETSANILNVIEILQEKFIILTGNGFLLYFVNVFCQSIWSAPQVQPNRPVERSSGQLNSTQLSSNNKQFN